MKTAKEITEYITKEHNHNEDMQVHLVAIFHEDSYWTKIDTLKQIREWMLQFEYYPNKEVAMKGIEDALKWVLE